MLIESAIVLFDVIFLKLSHQSKVNVSHPAVTSANVEARTFQFSLIHLDLNTVFFWDIDSFVPAELRVVQILG